MKNKILISLITILIVSGGVAFFSAFEAHIVNVTAHIENALMVIPPDEMTFGTVFPQEKLEQPFLITVSESFCNQNRVSTINYKIVQKPKCVNEAGDYKPVDYATHKCPEGYKEMPLLCPYLSKTIIDTDPKPYDDYGVPAFHELSEIATGTIDKDEDPNDFWLIDLDVPCFKGMCAQDWTHYGWELDPALESKTFGCDLWVEVTGISAGVNEKELACINSGGTVTTSMCCAGVGDFPDTCSVGACGCALEDSHEVKVCACGAGKCFDGNSCVSNHLVINEVYYDEPGTDGPNVFIEIFGPANFSLSGFSVLGISETPGNIYATISLSGSTDSNGYYLIVHNDANPGLMALADLITGKADLQNGDNDSVVLKHGEIVLDTLGYGANAPLYETSPAPDVTAGYSLSRDSSHTDTDNNSADFASSTPTPKAP